MSPALSRRMLAVLGALLLGLGLALGGALAPARALDGDPARAILKQDGRTLQKGKQGSYCWPTGPGEFTCADAVPSYPRVDRVAEGSKLRVRISESQKPRDLDLTAYRRVNANDVPVGDGQNLRYDWERVRRNGKTVAWEAVFRVGQPNRHYYLSAFGRWKKADASWDFHVKTGG